MYAIMAGSFHVCMYVNVCMGLWPMASGIWHMANAAMAMAGLWAYTGPIGLYAYSPIVQ